MISNSTTQFLDIGSETLAYEQHNTDSVHTILLVHGNMSNRTWWNEAIELLKDRFRILALDMRGFGQSSNNKPEATLGDMADDIIKFCQLKKLQNITLAGWSLGGLIVQKVAELAPELVKNLIMVCSVGHKGMTFYAADGKTVIRLYDELASHPRFGAMKAAIETKNQTMLRSVFNAVLFTYLQETSESRKTALIESCYTQRNYINMLELLAHSEIDLSKITARILIVSGQEDKVVPYANTETTIIGLQACKNPAKVINIPAAAHMVPIEHTSLFVSELVSFIQRKQQK